MRGWLRTLHRYAGALVAMYFIVIAASGTALVFRADVLAFAYGGARSGDQVSIVKSIATQHDGRFRAIALPLREGHPYIVYLPGHRTALHSAADGEAIEDRFGLVLAFDLLFDLHHYLLAGDLGKDLAGYFGLAAIGLLITGPILWWPWRRGFSPTRLWPKTSKPAMLVGAHVSLGIILAPLLLISAATGVSMIFNKTVKAGLVSVFGAEPASGPPPQVSAAGDGLTRAIAAVKAGFPGAAPRMYVPPRTGQSVARLRFKQQGEWTPNGRSYMHFDTQTNAVVRVTDSLKAGRGEGIYNALYPLHAGKMDNRLYQALVLCLGLGGTLLPYWGLRAFLKRRRGRA